RLGVGRRRPVRQIRQPHDDRAKESAGYLGSDITRDIRPRKRADRRQPDRHRGVEMCAADAADAVHRDRDGERPAGGDDDPAGIVALGALQDDVGHDAIAEDDEDGGAEELCEEWGHDDGGGERRYYRSPTASASCAESGAPCSTFPVARTGYCWKSLGTC